MAPSLYKDLVSILRQNDCTWVRRGKGSHEIWYSPKTDRHVTIFVGLTSRHTANAILKQAGIPKRF